MTTGSNLFRGERENWLAILGLSILIIGHGIRYIPNEVELDNTASWFMNKPDSTKTCRTFIGGYEYPYEKVIVNQSFNIHFEIFSNYDSCNANVSVLASGFEISGPTGKINVKDITDLYWNLLPKYIGSQEIIVLIDEHRHQIKLRVVESPRALQKTILEILRWFFGSILTLPWILGWFKQRKSKKKRPTLFDSKGNPI